MAIRIHVAADGTKTYQARYRDENRKSQTETFKTKRQAEQRLAQVMADKSRGDFVAPQRGRVLFMVLAEQWLATTVDVKPKTRSGYEWLLNKYVLPAFGERQVGRISATDVDRFVRGLTNGKGEPLSAQTVRRIATVLKMVLKHAVRTGAIKASPAAYLRLPRLTKRDMVFLTAAEVEAVCDELHPRDALHVRFAVYSGLRAGEIVGLRWQDIDLETGRLYVRRNVADVGGRLVVDTPKTKGSSRSFTLPALLIEELRTEKASRSKAGPVDPVFPDSNGGLLRHQNFYKRYFKPAVSRALPDKAHLRFHDLRHTCVALLKSAGVASDASFGWVGNRRGAGVWASGRGRRVSHCG